MKFRNRSNKSSLLVKWRLYGEVQRVDEVDQELPRWETMMMMKGKGEDLPSRRVHVVVVIYSIVVYVHVIVVPS